MPPKPQPKPRRKSDSLGALAQEWSLGLSSLPAIRAEGDQRARWPTALSSEDRGVLIAEIESRLKTARRDSADRALGNPGDAAQLIASGVVDVFGAASVLYAQQLREASVRQTAAGAQRSQIEKFGSRVTRFVEAEARSAPTPQLRAAIKAAGAFLQTRITAETQRAQARPTRATRSPDPAPGCLLVALAWWWLEQGWTPNTHDNGCYVATARILDGARTAKQATFKRELITSAITEAKKLHADGGDMLRDRSKL